MRARILAYLDPRNLVRYIFHRLDVRRVKRSVLEDLGKEYKRNPSISVGEAVNEIWGDLDVALVGAGAEYSGERVRTIRDALDSPGVSESSAGRLENYLQT